jgi:hypothetical protein
VERRLCAVRRRAVRRRPPKPRKPRPSSPFFSEAGKGVALLVETAKETGDAVAITEDALFDPVDGGSASPQAGQRVKQPRAFRSGDGVGLGVLIGESISATRLDIFYLVHAKSLYAAGVFIFDGPSVIHSALIS